MSIYTRIASGLLFPVHERLKGHDSVRRLRGLEETQWWPRARIEALQLENLRRFLADIEAHVPYYKSLFAEHGFRSSDLRSVDDLRAIPFLTKPLIKAAGKDMMASDAGPVTRYNTGGSGGEPLIFYIGKDRKSHDVAAKWRATRWWGVDIGDPEIVLWGSPIELGAQDRVKMVRDRVLRSWLLPAFEMSEANVLAMLKNIVSLRPKMLFGYPSALAHIAEVAASHAIRLDNLGIRVAFVTSERLYDHQRETITKAFNCPVANGYGARDAGFLAHECPAGNLHLSAEDILLETVDENGQPTAPGVAGEIVVTHMASRDFPFLRYKTGDVGTLADEPCSCGRGLPVLKEVQGRTTDFIVAEDGTVMHGLALVYTARDIPGVRKFKIVQHSLHRTELLIVPGDGYEKDLAEARIRKDYRGRLGQGVDIEINYCDEIPLEKSGKFRYVISHVSPPRG